jgi:putative adhesin
MRFAIVLASGLLLPITLLNAQELVGRSEKVFTLTESIASGNTLRVFTPSGKLTILPATDGRIAFRGEKDVRNADIEDIAFQVIRSSDGVTICALFGQDDECTERGVRSDNRSGRWFRNRHMLVDVTVHVPRGVKLHAGTGNGEVSVDGVGAEATISTGNGRMRITNVSGELEASSGNGAVFIERTTGPVHASSGNGDVTVRASRGPITVSSGNGDIDVTMEELRIEGDMEFTTGNGSVRVTVPDGFAGDLSADTGNGHFVTDFPMTLQGRFREGHVRGTIGGGGRRVRLSSGNGRIELRKRA